MREVKFRAWNRKAQSMGDWQYLKKSKRPTSWLHWAFEGDDNIVLMQYTGLKDKNGVEIYEGDVVKIGKYVYKVEWDALTCAFRISDCPAIGAVSNAFEVIGNIHEHPELVTA